MQLCTYQKPLVNAITRVSLLSSSCQQRHLRRRTWTGDFKCREVKTGFYRNRSMQTGSSGTLIGWKSESVATLPPFSPIEGQKWFDQISSQWESQKNRFALIYFGKIQFLPPCIWNLPFMSTASGQTTFVPLWDRMEGAWLRTLAFISEPTT